MKEINFDKAKDSDVIKFLDLAVEKSLKKQETLGKLVEIEKLVQAYQEKLMKEYGV